MAILSSRHRLLLSGSFSCICTRPPSSPTTIRSGSLAGGIGRTPASYASTSAFRSATTRLPSASAHRCTCLPSRWVSQSSLSDCAAGSKVSLAASRANLAAALGVSGTSDGSDQSRS